MPTRTPAKINVGGVEVTPDEIRSAIKILASAKGIMVRQPLTKADHPLAGTDYHRVAHEHRQIDGDRTVGTKIMFLRALEVLIAG